MNLSDFDYELPAGSIAQRPLAERDASRMLLLSRVTGAWEDRQFRELPVLLRGNELLVLNDARVLPARLSGHRAGLRAAPPSENSPVRDEFLTSPIEVLLVRQLAPDTWEALVRPGRKIPVGERIVFGEGELQARVEGRAEYGLRV
ncbi:MAG TPA: S-adenosylmethionine:tRNA ribosyltransferase-isomerase, partial [Candidatus Dormibacteraeota bacterium]|nr:S-adenosylmethionine:tRNA ribosyltransferase-isomerase [Candidatus Dormibacteraeota bacterium]